MLISFPANHTQGMFWWQLYFLTITFMCKIFIFAHFSVDLQPIRPKFEKRQPRWYVRHIQLRIFQKWHISYMIYGFSTEKTSNQNVKKHPCWDIRSDCGPLRQKSKIKARHWNSDTFRNFKIILIFSDKTLVSLFHRKKLRNSCFKGVVNANLDKNV